MQDERRFIKYSAIIEEGLGVLILSKAWAGEYKRDVNEQSGTKPTSELQPRTTEVYWYGQEKTTNEWKKMSKYLNETINFSNLEWEAQY